MNPFRCELNQGQSQGSYTGHPDFFERHSVSIYYRKTFETLPCISHSRAELRRTEPCVCRDCSLQSSHQSSSLCTHVVHCRLMHSAALIFSWQQFEVRPWYRTSLTHTSPRESLPVPRWPPTLTTRKLSYRKIGRAMRPICVRPENYRKSLTTSTATFPEIFV